MMRLLIAVAIVAFLLIPFDAFSGDLKTQRVFGGWRNLNGTLWLIDWSLGDSDQGGASETGGHQPITNDIDAVGFYIQGNASHAGSVGRIVLFRAQPGNNTQIGHCPIPPTIQEFGCWIPLGGKMRFRTDQQPAIEFSLNGVGPNFVGNVSAAIHVYYEDAPAP